MNEFLSFVKENNLEVSSICDGLLGFFTESSPVLSLVLLQDSAQEGVITRDIHRTFPAHDYFRDAGDGQDSLYKICKVGLRPTGSQVHPTRGL